MCQQKKSDGASLQSEMAYLDCPMTKKPAQRGFAEVDRIIHHVQSLYLQELYPLLILLSLKFFATEPL
jgi:hypothetical protein